MSEEDEFKKRVERRHQANKAQISDFEKEFHRWHESEFKKRIYCWANSAEFLTPTEVVVGVPELRLILEDVKKAYIGFENEILSVMAQPHLPKERYTALKYAYETLHQLNITWFGDEKKGG